MGGTVGVTLRAPDGTVHKMCRRTHDLPWMVIHAGLFDKDTAHLQACLKTWQAMTADYAAHQATGRYDHRLTPHYAPYDLLAPMEYGLVVIDLQHNVILTNQDYTGFNYVLTYGADFGRISLDQVFKNPHSWLPQVKGLIEGGYISHMHVRSLRPDPHATIPAPQAVDVTGQPFTQVLATMLTHFSATPETTLEALVAELFVPEDTPLALHYPTLNAWVDPYVLEELEPLISREAITGYIDSFTVVSPLAIETFERRGTAPARAFKARVLDLGFDLNKRDETAWHEWMELQAEWDYHHPETPLEDRHSAHFLHGLSVPPEEAILYNWLDDVTDRAGLDDSWDALSERDQETCRAECLALIQAQRADGTVEALVEDLRDRLRTFGTLDAEWSGIDDDVLAEIEMKWTEIIRAHWTTSELVTR